jgi:hypothetical protein
MNINTTDNSSLFTTYDLGTAAALLCSNFLLISLDRTNSRRVLFVFKRAKRIDIIANAYFANRLRLNARSFFDQLKALKSRLYNE